jgi:hypothetical protein
MSSRSDRLAIIPNIKDRALVFALALHTFLEDTERYYEAQEAEVRPEILIPAEIA